MLWNLILCEGRIAHVPLPGGVEVDTNVKVDGIGRVEGGGWRVGVICTMQCGGEAGKIIQDASSYTTLEFVKY